MVTLDRCRRRTAVEIAAGAPISSQRERKYMIPKDKAMNDENPNPDSKPAPPDQVAADAVEGASTAHAGATGNRAPGDTAEGGSDPSSVQARLADAEARAAEYLDMVLRTRAEMENLRKRGQLDLAAAHKYAIEGFAESMLPVRDSLEMALKVDTPTIENLREGVEATLRLLASAFDKHKLLVIEPVGEKFDPNRHQAISMVPAAHVAPNHVVSVLQKGYLINDRVLRPALVTVRGGS